MRNYSATGCPTSPCLWEKWGFFEYVPAVRRFLSGAWIDLIAGLDFETDGSIVHDPVLSAQRRHGNGGRGDGGGFRAEDRGPKGR